MSTRKLLGYVIGLAGCASIAYALHGLLGGFDVANATEAVGYIPFLIGGIFASVIGTFLGGMLVFPLTFAGVGIGALTAEGGDSSFSLVFGGIFLAVAVLIFGLGLYGRVLGGKKAVEAQHLLAVGTPAIATILHIRDTGVRINNNPRVTLHVRLDPQNGGPSLEAEKTVLMRMVQPFHIGQRFPAVFDPNNTASWALITDVTDMSRVPPHLVPLIRSVGPGAPPVPDLAGQLSQLDSLRRSGALTDRDYEAAKARLLGT